MSGTAKPTQEVREPQAREELPEWRIRYLDPRKTRLVDRGDGRIHLLEEDRCHLDVGMRWCFPRSRPGRYLSISNARDEEIGVVKEPHKFDRASRRLVARGLERRYFVPKITQILKADEKGGMVYCVVDTDRGRHEFAVNDPRSNVQDMDGERYLIRDVDGNMYEIPDLRQLDEKSQVRAALIL